MSVRKRIGEFHDMYSIYVTVHTSRRDQAESLSSVACFGSIDH